ncbi:hypothetical protein OIU35_32815 [Boseaceae bacterium BT-24-1]|nr:hypothetical protein [Boseaceae bacterium BT-24-1]
MFQEAFLGILKPEIIAAFLSFLATVSAAVAAYRAPIAAAEYAETLRRKSADDDNRRRIKLNVFGQIMQERADISQRDCVVALNLIDVAFYDAPDVREAWAELYQSLDSARQVPGHVRDERLRKLLRAMAADLGLADNLRLDDFGRVYFPNTVAEENEVRRLERQATMKRLSAQSAPAQAQASPAETVSNSQTPGWPPRPG